jgi:hypothetical protein
MIVLQSSVLSVKKVRNASVDCLLSPYQTAVSSSQLYVLIRVLELTALNTHSASESSARKLLQNGVTHRLLGCVLRVDKTSCSEHVVALAHWFLGRADHVTARRHGTARVLVWEVTAVYWVSGHHAGARIFRSRRMGAQYAYNLYGMNIWNLI